MEHQVTEEGRLDETFVDALCEPPEMFTYGGMIAHVLTFAAHRRTLVVGALSDAGITDLVRRPDALAGGLRT
jgi:AraC family transcriptional regulator